MCLRDLLFELGEEVEGVDGLELVEVGFAQFVEHFAIERRKQDVLVAIAGR